jgi:CCR4-NOT transcriptional regulation complex NOT5 subunit
MNSCDGMGMEAYCLLSSESSDGTCTLRQASTNPSNPVSGSSPTTSPPSTSVSATTKEVEVDSAQSGALMTRSQRFMMSMSVIVVIVFVVMFM